MTKLKYEFASAEWRSFMHGLLCERLSRTETSSSDSEWSFCEVFTDAPEHLRTDGASAAWHCIVRGREIEFGSTELENATMKVVADYQSILPLARYDTLDEIERQKELGELSKTLMAQGKLKIIGDPTKLDPEFGSVHDPMAKVTL